MTLKQAEAVDILNKLDIPCSDRTLLNYEKWGLISIPKRGSGKKGKWTHYPIESVSDAIVAWRLIHGEYEAEGIYDFFDGKVPKISPKIISIAKEFGEPIFALILEKKIPFMEYSPMFYDAISDAISKLGESSRIPARAITFMRWVITLWIEEKLRATLEVSVKITEGFFDRCEKRMQNASE